MTRWEDIGGSEIPELLDGLRDPALVDASLDGLYWAITPQGDRCTATPPTVPLLVDAVLDSRAPYRFDILHLIRCAAIGTMGDQLDWRVQRAHQVLPEEVASWDAVVAEHSRLIPLLADGDRNVSRAALVVLAWTGCAEHAVLEQIGAGTENTDEVEQCTAWLAAVILGTLPSDLSAPRGPSGGGPLRRFGQSMAALRFRPDDASPACVDELCRAFESVEGGDELTRCDFLIGEEPSAVCKGALSRVPAHLRRYTAAKLLGAVSRGELLGTGPLRTYLRLVFGEPRRLRSTALGPDAVASLQALVPPLASWRPPPQEVSALRSYGLPPSARAFTAWLEGVTDPDELGPDL
ncbi:MAG TPA: hypothetical protein VFJ85_20005 [Acidimicrobiales bacterium]|nr:hypothetical protein [Acidimicrobiales bacterium]